MDYFALGGVLVDKTDIEALKTAHAAFLAKWGLTAPLHSTKIRGQRGAYSWIRTEPERAKDFFLELDALVLGAPIVSISCVIDRPGYVARYAEKYPQPWLLCQTAFAILVERAAKYARTRDATLEVYFEESGKMEDRAILEYMKKLKAEGMPFAGSTAAGYASLQPDDFQAIVRGQPKRVTKKVPMMQLADLVLYAMARGGYFPDYAPYRALHDHQRIIDAIIDAARIPMEGVKYSCFDTKKARTDPSL